MARLTLDCEEGEHFEALKKFTQSDLLCFIWEVNGDWCLLEVAKELLHRFGSSPAACVRDCINGYETRPDILWASPGGLFFLSLISTNCGGQLSL